MNIIKNVSIDDVKNIGVKSISCETVVYPTKDNNLTAFVNVTMSNCEQKFKYTGYADSYSANSDNPQAIIDAAMNNAITRTASLAMDFSNTNAQQTVPQSRSTSSFPASPPISDRTQNRHSKSKPISDGQKTFLYKLAREKASSADSLARKKFGTSVDDLSSWQCQEILIDLKYGS